MKNITASIQKKYRYRGVDTMAIDRLEIIVEAEAKKASSELDKLIDKLGQVSTALNGLKSSGLNNLSSGIRQLSSAMSTMSGVKTTDFNRLAKNIEKLGSINKTGLLNAADAIDELVKSVNSMGSISDDAVRIGDLASNISKLGGKSATQAITNLPLLSVALRDFMTTVSSSPLVSQNLINMTNAMANLASQGSKYGSTVKGIASATNTLTKAQKAHTASTFSLTAQVTKLVAAYYTLRRVIGFIGDSITKSMDYTETINLFQTTYKKIGMETAVDMGMEWGSATADSYAKGFIKAAESFNDTLTESLGLDPNVMKQYQAIFAQMTNSMGLVAASSMNIADSFTMLGNDIASLWNIDTADAMKKLQSGLAGQIRPLRSLGIDISQTSLEMTALKYGIEDSVISMSQAAKVQLRWLSIMDQTEVAFGDMAKTIDSPKNQLRILEQQWSNLSRSIGNVFLPAISNVLPYINAVVIALRGMIDTMASAMGYELPDYSDSNIYTDLTGEIDGMTESTEDATEANNKLKQSILSFDELNILGKNSGKNGLDMTGSGYGVLDDAINEKTASYMKKFNEELDKMSSKSKDLLKKLEPLTKEIKDLWKELKPFANNVGEGLQWFYDNVLEPMSKLVIDETIPDVLYAMSSALGLLNTVMDKFKKSKTDDTIFGFLADIQRSKLKDISDGFKKIGDAFTALDKFIQNPNWKDAWGYIKNALSVGFDISGAPDFTDPLSLLGLPDEVKIPIKAFIATTWDMLKQKWQDLSKNFKGKTVEFVVKLITSLGDIKNFISALIKAINTNVLSKLTFKVDLPFTDKDWVWKAPLITDPFAEKNKTHSSGVGHFATGGIPDYGQMFIAREAGPELVGNIGTRNAVVNNDQITTSVAQAVKGAIIEAFIPIANNIGNNKQTGDIYLVTEDYEVIARMANKGNESMSARFRPVRQGG